ncbi:MAG: sporulation peptidase YabG [Firmicutes bacterium HGW-Firmicutes-13]|nr:MAG: sporulation peptidase YabG [Firmicutes bacterium HGW-Firmicutes-13]
MDRLEIGDIVCRRSYGGDILFKIINIDEEKKVAAIKGLDVRLIADAPLQDLEKPVNHKICDMQEKYKMKARGCMSRIIKQRSMYRETLRKSNSGESFFDIPGKVLHLDGDSEYLKECLKAYKNLDIRAEGIYVPEKQQPEAVDELLRKVKPDILVLTGHDAYLKGKKNFKELNNYRNSKYYVRSTIIARKYVPDKDSLVIFAGACQSHYEALLEAGANFAASPQRVLIHCLDPVFLIEKIAYTSIKQTVNIFEAINNTITGIDGLGGIETQGTFRLGLPKSPY